MDEKYSSGLPNLSEDASGAESSKRPQDREPQGAGPRGPELGSMGFDIDLPTSTEDPLIPDGPELADAEELMDAEVDVSFVGEDLADEEETDLQREVRGFFTALVKTIRAAHLYVQGNPLLHRFFDDLSERAQRIWTSVPHLTFSIYESRIVWDDAPVYQGRPGGQENLAFMLYKDGIRRLELHPGFEEHELRQFIDILRLSKSLRGDEEDLLTLMWNADFKNIRYEYVDVLGDEPPLPTGAAEAPKSDAELPLLPELEVSPELQSPALREDFEPSLYFLGEEEVASLQRELMREWERPVKREVMLAVLDQNEMGDEERRAEVAEILRQLLPRLLAEGEFGDAAFIVSELRGIAEKLENEAVAQQVEGIVAELSQPIVVDQLVRVMEDGSLDPKCDELATLLSALQPQAIEVLIQALPTISRAAAREQLGATLDRLAAKNPDLMTEFIKSEDPRVAAESARIAARLKMVAVADAIASLLLRPSPEVRLAAVEALVAIRSSIAGGPLIKALEDQHRDVRLAAARGLAELKYSPSAKKLESLVTGKELQGRDLTEQLAFFEAFAVTAGEDGARLLSRMLNGRRFLWVKYPSRMRACSARALGLVGGEAAREALDIAQRDRDPMVLSAVHAARRGPDGGEG